MAEKNKVPAKGNEAMERRPSVQAAVSSSAIPITPQTEVAAYMAKPMPKEGGTYLQAESEIAAINMVYGIVGRCARHDLVVFAGRVA